MIICSEQMTLCGWNYFRITVLLLLLCDDGLE